MKKIYIKSINLAEASIYLTEKNSYVTFSFTDIDFEVQQDTYEKEKAVQKSYIPEYRGVFLTAFLVSKYYSTCEPIISMKVTCRTAKKEVRKFLEDIYNEYDMKAEERKEVLSWFGL